MKCLHLLAILAVLLVGLDSVHAVLSDSSSDGEAWTNSKNRITARENRREDRRESIWDRIKNRFRKRHVRRDERQDSRDERQHNRLTSRQGRQSDRQERRDDFFNDSWSD